MATYSPPSENLSTFNPYFFEATNATSAAGVSVSFLNSHYIKYPTTQSGTINVAGNFNITKNNTNQFFGYESGLNVTSGTSNSAFGYNALKEITSGTLNTALGDSAGLSISTGTGNCIFGRSAADLLTTGSSNVAFGLGALSDLTTADNNTAIGRNTLLLTTGEKNTAVGDSAGDSNTTGEQNTYLGFDATSNAGNYSYSTALGTGATITASNQIMMGTATEKVTIPNQIAISYSSNPTLGTTSLGYIVQYSVPATNPFNSLIVGSFTNLPIGIYTVNLSFVNYNIAANTRNDLFVSTSTNITVFSGSSLEFGGNSIGKMPVTNTYIIKATSNTNSFIITFANNSGTAGSILASNTTALRLA